MPEATRGRRPGRALKGRFDRLVRRFVPSTTLLTRGVFGRVLDLDDLPRRVFSERPPVPPNHLRVRVGTGNRLFFNHSQFERLGAHECLDLFAHGWLQPDSRIVDIGCGCGRTAAPLRQTRGFRGSYLGIDVDPEMIDWCRENLIDPRFRFEVADTYNSVYNPGGSRSPYRLPVADQSQDLVFSHSLFTHLLEDDLANYVRESSRVLCPGGVMAMTVFCTDHPESAAGNSSRFSFRHSLGEAMVEDRRLPEAAVAYPADFLRSVCLTNGFALAHVESGSGQSRLIAAIAP